MRCAAALVPLCVLFTTCSTTPPAPAEFTYPPFEPPPVRAEVVVDDYHGTPIEDPYRWLEDQDGAETADFVRRQNLASRAFLDAIPERAAIRDRLAELWNYPRRGAPGHYGDRWFFATNDGLQNQDVQCVAATPDGDGEVVLDPNTLSLDGTVALAGFEPSHDGSLVAFATSAAGSDWQTWRVIDVATKRVLSDTVEWAKFTGAAWTHDGKGFFYQRFPTPTPGQIYESSNQNAQLCYHVLGTDQADDKVVYERTDEPLLGFRATVTDSGRYLIVSARAGSDRKNRIVYADLEAESWHVLPMLAQGDAQYDFVGHAGDRFWFRTDRDAPMGCILEMSPMDKTHRKVLVPEGTEALQRAQLLGGHFVLTYQTDASSRVAVHALDGEPKGQIELPGIGSVGRFSGQADDPLAFATFQSFVTAPQVLRHDFATGTTTIGESPIAIDPDRFVTSRKFLQSKDGTRLCMFIVHAKGLALDGNNACYLFGYGGFNLAMAPRFSVPNLAFVERGGVYAQAVLRGGSEYGEAWHAAGMLEKKQNVFDDFIACAEYLVRNGYTNSGKLAVGGVSNGGLLVGAVMTQRPSLFGAAIPEVGVMDMLRYHTFTIGHAWAPEYGRSDDPEAFQWLRAYSPLHNIRAGVSYPPTMVMTGDHDDRVLPGHSYKFGAALQSAQGGVAPVLLRVETSAGHGSGKPLSKQIDEAADRWAFLEAVLR